MITRETVYRPDTVSFFFDPICPWTWITSRWLIEVAEARRVRIHWRTMSLAMLNGGVERMPEEYQELGRFSMGALRMIEALRAADEDGRVGPFYTQLGARLLVEGERADRQLLQAAADAAGIAGYLPASQDRHWDGFIEQSTDFAMRLAGPDIGSPVLRLGDQARGTHGPILSPAPTGDAALRLWDALLMLADVPGFYEVKHGRSGAPQMQPVESRRVGSSGLRR